MNFVDEQHVVGLQVGQDRGQVAGVVQDEPGGRTDVAAHFPGDDVRDGGLAQAWRAVEDGVVQGFAAALRRLDADPQGFFHAFLAGVVVQGLRAQGAFGVLFFFQEMVGDDAVFHAGDRLDLGRRPSTSGAGALRLRSQETYASFDFTPLRSG